MKLDQTGPGRMDVLVDSGDTGTAVAIETFTVLLSFLFIKKQMII